MSAITSVSESEDERTTGSIKGRSSSATDLNSSHDVRNFISVTWTMASHHDWESRDDVNYEGQHASRRAIRCVK